MNCGLAKWIVIGGLSAGARSILMTPSLNLFGSAGSNDAPIRIRPVSPPGSDPEMLW